MVWRIVTGLFYWFFFSSEKDYHFVLKLNLINFSPQFAGLTVPTLKALWIWSSEVQVDLAQYNIDLYLRTCFRSRPASGCRNRKNSYMWKQSEKWIYLKSEIIIDSWFQIPRLATIVLCIRLQFIWLNLALRNTCSICTPRNTTFICIYWNYQIHF